MTAGELADRLGLVPEGTEVVFDDERLGLVTIEEAKLDLRERLVVAKRSDRGGRVRTRVAAEQPRVRVVILS